MYIVDFSEDGEKIHAAFMFGIKEPSGVFECQ